MASDANVNDLFGTAVAISGDYVIVGTGKESNGAVYVFICTSQNSCDGGTKLQSPNAGSKENFGNSVGIYNSGDSTYAIVGAHGNEKAYIFYKSGDNAWARRTLSAAGGTSGDAFGSSVAISGSYAIVGAPMEDLGSGTENEDKGAVYIYHRTGNNNWTTVHKLVAFDGVQASAFGWSVDIDGDYAVVGSSGKTAQPIESRFLAGAVYLFNWTGTSWGVGTSITSPSPVNYGAFGASVNIDGEYIVVSEARYTGPESNPFQTWNGRAYSYKRSGASWGGVKTLGNSYEGPNTWYAYSVAVNGTNAMVSGTAATANGVAYRFQRTGNNWNNGTAMVAPDGQANDGFGIADIDGNRVVVGAPLEDGLFANPKPDQGAAYLFDL
jgi:hypothetical protein